MTYKISRRIEAEERALENAMVVFTSTQEEVDKQWGLYDACAPQLISRDSCLPQQAACCTLAGSCSSRQEWHSVLACTAT